MVRRISGLTAVAAFSLSFASSAFAGLTTYDFSSASGSSTPAVIALATFSSPADPGAFTFGPNAGLFSDLGSYVLSSNGNVETLDISFAAPQDSISLDYAIDDFFASGSAGPDSLTVTTSQGLSQTETAALVGSDFFPEGFLTLSSPAQPFTSVAITSAYAFDIADLTTVPEPASLVLFGAGVAGLLRVRRRRA
jgi:hypothetical protein